MAADKVLNIIIKAKDEASKNIDKVSKSSGGLSKGFKGIAIAAGLAATATIAVGAAIVKFGKRGAIVNSIEASFKNLSYQAGTTADVFSAKLNNAFMGTIAKADLMKIANESLQAGLSPKNIESMAGAAVGLSKTLGISVTDAYSRLNKVMVTGTTTAAQKLGITIDAKKANDNYAKSIGKASKDLSANERIEAKRILIMDQLNEKTKEGVANTKDFGDWMDIGAASIKDFSDNLAKTVDVTFTPYIAAIVAEMKKTKTGFTDSGKQSSYLEKKLKSLVGGLKILGRAFVILKSTGIWAFKMLKLIGEKQLAAMLLIIGKSAELVVAPFALIPGKIGKPFREAKESLHTFNEAQKDMLKIPLSDRIKDINNELIINIANYDEVAEKIEETAEANIKLAKAQKEATKPSEIAKYTKEIKKAKKEVESLAKEGWNATMNAAVNTSNKLLDLASSNLEDKKTKIAEESEAKLAALETEKEAEINKVNEDITNKADKMAALSKIESKYSKKKEILEKKADKESEKIAKKQKAISYAQAVSGTALAVVNAMQTKPFIPLGLIAAAAAAASGAIQIATIAAQPYAQGGVVGGSEQVIRVNEKGPEYVVNAEATRKNRGLLDRINAGGGTERSFIVNITMDSPQIMNTNDFIEEEFIPKINTAVKKGLTVLASEVH